jgi:O-acetyl-ADP-ribose deacetylase (regulator of RNase III)
MLQHFHLAHLEAGGNARCFFPDYHEVSSMRREHLLANGRRLILMEGDITRVPVDAISNAANSALAGGGGVDGAIHRAGGPAIMEQLDRIRPALVRLPPGQAVATTAGRLPAKYVLHAVGPVWHGGARGEPEALASCYRVCLTLAEERGLRSVSFPSISTGIYGYPLELAAPVAVREILTFLTVRAVSIESVWMVVFDSITYSAYQRALLLVTQQQAQEPAKS